MLFEIAFVILPVFILVTAGFISSYIQLLKRRLVDGLTKFCQDFGIPFLLFFNLAILDLDKAFDFRILISFYSSMIISFFLISSTSFFIFNKPYKSCVVLGFCAMFSNGVLLGLPISELAYGVDSLSVNYTIIIGHAPLCYLVGIAFIEIANNKKNSLLVSLKSSFKAIVFNNLAIGILLGIGLNLLNLEFSKHIEDLLKRGTTWIIPISLFTMGGILYYYRITNSIKIPFTIILISLFIQPAVVYLLGVYYWDIEIELLRNAVVMASMAPGLNAYFFANIYGQCRDIVATTILVSTGLTIFTSSFWIYYLS